jgi:Uma2 family endonuclease
MTVREYLYDTDETRRKRELHCGRICEPPAPYFSHQQLVLRVARLIGDHVEPRRIGRVAVAPVDVLLDERAGLVLQPDVLFIAEDRTSIIHNQVWGAPDLVVEVLSSSNHVYDRTQKLRWYGQYGVRECWLVDSRNVQVWVVDFSVDPPEERVATAIMPIRSTVLPDLDVTACGLFL